MAEQRTAQQQIHDTNAESVAATRRIRALAEQSREAGIDTMNELDRQGEALDRAEKGLDTINQDMNQAEENLDNLEKCCGVCLCPWNRKNRTNNYDKHNKGKGKQKSDRAAYSSSENVTTQQPGGGQAAMIRVTNDDAEDEMEDNINAVGDITAQLKHMALDMGGELDRQNDQIDRMNNKAQANKDRIQNADNQAKNILK